MRTKVFYCHLVITICPFSYEVFSVIYIFSSSFCLSVNYNSLLVLAMSWNFTPASKIICLHFQPLHISAKFGKLIPLLYTSCVRRQFNKWKCGEKITENREMENWDWNKFVGLRRVHFNNVYCMPRIIKGNSN